MHRAPAFALLLPASTLATFTAGPGQGFATLTRARSAQIEEVGGANGCAADSIRKNQTTVEGGKILMSIAMPFDPAWNLADDVCCSLVSSESGLYYTNVKWRPAGRKYPGQYYYICTLYQNDGSSEPTFHPGNESTTAGFAKHPPPPDPNCTQRTTVEDCVGTGPGQAAQCAWWNRTCHYEPPIECMGLDTPTNELKPQCINIILADHTFPAGPQGRKLGSFNWSSGTVTEGENPVIMPAQVLQLRESNWWSVDSGYSLNSSGGLASHPYQVCVTYNEILPDGKHSDPDTGFSACLSGPGMMDATRGQSKNMDSFVNFGSTSPDYAKAAAFWVTYIFWSNETSATQPIAPPLLAHRDG